METQQQNTQREEVRIPAELILGLGEKAKETHLFIYSIMEYVFEQTELLREQNKFLRKQNKLLKAQVVCSDQTLAILNEIRDTI